MTRIVFDAPVFGKAVGSSEEVEDSLALNLCKAGAAHVDVKAEPRGKETVKPIRREPRTHEAKHPHRKE